MGLCYLAGGCLFLVSCDYTASGWICNYSNENIEIVIYPGSQASKDYSFKSKDMEFINYDILTDRAYYKIVSQKCIHVVEGINGLRPDDLSFSYLEIRTSFDTVIFVTKPEIFSQFKEISEAKYQLELF